MFVLAVAALACTKAAPPSRDSTAAAVSGTSGTGPTRAPCPKTGHWSVCQVKMRLDQAGVAPRADSAPPKLPSLGPAPTIYLVGTSSLAFYLFPDGATRARAAIGLDTTQFIAPSAALSMRGEATVIQNDNLLALLFRRNDHQRERVSDALTAGAPQP